MDFYFFYGNWCKLFFTSTFLLIVICGGLINICEPYLPTFLNRIYRYGKFASKQENALAKKLEVPKAYFRHFYLVAVLFYYPVAFSEVFSAYIFDSDVSKWVLNILDFCCGPNRTATVPTTRVLLSVILLLLQAGRRFFDTHFISVFSKNARINLIHYLVGIIYYPAIMLVILSEAPKFVRAGFEDNKLRFSDVGFTEISVVILFMWAWYHQHVTTVILANLRKNKKGEIVTQNYKIPQGDWFKYVSSPHSTAEIVMYTALTILLANNTGWLCVYAWVICNQVQSILLSHWWYQSNFKDFPNSRKALIPFVY